MEIGLGHHPAGNDLLRDIVNEAVRAESLGFASYSVPHIFAHDALTALAVVAGNTERIELMSAAVPVFPRHPLALAQQALSVQAVAQGRFTLGVGTSQSVVIDGMHGLPFDHVVTRTQEYLAVLLPLLAGERVNVTGRYVRARASLRVPDASATECLLAAMGPQMLQLAGEHTAGTITWLAGPRALADHIVPSIREAAERSGRPEPRIVCSLPIALTDDPVQARRLADRRWGIYQDLPSYRRVLDLESVASPSEVAILGDEGVLDDALDGLERAGVTLFLASPFPADDQAYERTLAYLAPRAAEARV